MRKPCRNFKPTLKPTLNTPIHLETTLNQPYHKETMSLWWPTRHAEGQSPLAPSGAVEGDWLHRGGWLTQGGLTLLGDWFRLVSPLHRHLRRYCQNDITDITMISFFRQSKTHSIRIGEAWKEAIPTYLSPSFNMPKGATSRSKKKLHWRALGFSPMCK